MPVVLLLCPDAAPVPPPGPELAAFGARPGMGTVQCESSKVKLDRNSNSPYQSEGMSATKPQLGFKGKKRA